ncbi:MAG: alpha/beta fold hydrolase [Patescibacteria group bacterium]
MEPKTIDIECKGYAVKADIYKGNKDSVVALFLIGRTSSSSKPRYKEFLPRLAQDLGITSVIFDYTGHGDSPFDIEDLSPAQHFLEVITVFDWMKEKYPSRRFFVVGSSYGGFLATQLTKYKNFDGLILQAPAIYRPVDFYTPAKKWDENATYSLRRDVEALAKHPLLERAAQFEGKVLLVVHKRDERIPKETTDAYANALHPEVIVEDIPHSLGKATEQELASYNQKLFDWIASNLS